MVGSIDSIMNVYKAKLINTAPTLPKNTLMALREDKTTAEIASKYQDSIRGILWPLRRA